MQRVRPAATAPRRADQTPPARLPDLKPARWIWYPSERCLQNTFVLFRRELTLAARRGGRRVGIVCGQPVSPGSERQADSMGPGAVGPALDGGGPG